MIDTETLKQKLEKNKKSSFEYQQRRHLNWDENYTLYRDKVITNRLTQRQSVNIPLMKTTIKTIMDQIDDPPDLKFEELSNDKQKEIFLNEYFTKNAEDNKLDIKDTVDKKQELIYGRTFKKLNIDNGQPYVEVLDPYDILVDRYTDPADLDSAQFIIHQNIFRTLNEISGNPNYDKGAINRIKKFFSTEEGLIVSGENAQHLQEKNQRMETMGETDVNNPELGETYVELNEHYIKIWNDQTNRFEIHLIVTCDGAGTEILMDQPLEDVLGKTVDDYWVSHYPILSWAEDVERSDFWSDGTGDIVRVPNKVVNAWFSQLVENRTLRNFGMNFFDATIEGFAPTTFEARPFGWYPLPGKPSDVFQKVDIPDLSNNINDIQYIINLMEKTTGATAIEQGVLDKNRVTLGQVQILLAKSSKRMHGIAKFYTQSWKEFGEKWVKLVEAQADNLTPVKLYKKSFRGNFFSKTIKSSDWKSNAGYSVKVMSSAEQERANIGAVQRLSAAVAQMPTNKPLIDIYHRKLLDLSGLNLDEIREILNYDNQQGQLQGQIPQMTPQQSPPTQVKQPIPVGQPNQNITP